MPLIIMLPLQIFTLMIIFNSFILIFIEHIYIYIPYASHYGYGHIVSTITELVIEGQGSRNIRLIIIQIMSDTKGKFQSV